MYHQKKPFKNYSFNKKKIISSESDVYNETKNKGILIILKKKNAGFYKNICFQADINSNSYFCMMGLNRNNFFFLFLVEQSDKRSDIALALERIHVSGLPRNLLLFMINKHKLSFMHIA